MDTTHSLIIIAIALQSLMAIYGLVAVIKLASLVVSVEESVKQGKASAERIAEIAKDTHKMTLEILTHLANREQAH